MNVPPTKLLLLAVAAYLTSGVALWAQAPSSQSDAANTNWTSTTDSHNGDADPIRTIESHSQSGNRTLDKQSVERRGDDGGFVPYQDIEKETVQVDAATVRTITRTFTRDADGAKQLVEVVEEEKHTAGGDSTVVRSTSDPDVNGNLQVIRRQTEQTTKTSPNVEVIKTTVQLPDVNGGLAAAVKVEEHRERSSDGGANGAVESQKTTLLPDGAGNWQVGEIRRTTIAQEGDHRTIDERVSLPDSEGKIGEVSRTITNEASTGPGEQRNTVETYSISLPGAVADGRLHLVERDITAQQTSATGQQVTRQQVEQAKPGDPGSGLQVTTVTIDTVRPGASGVQATRTIQARDANGSFPVISMDTTKSDNIHAVQVQIAPSDAPKKEAK
ncbi:MAG: hypothetical protein WCC78_03855 [Terriglobales bacterium]